jgi:hypothetical protein
MYVCTSKCGNVTVERLCLGAKYAVQLVASENVF